MSQDDRWQKNATSQMSESRTGRVPRTLLNARLSGVFILRVWRPPGLRSVKMYEKEKSAVLPSLFRPVSPP